jgi:hypothetical protein
MTQNHPSTDSGPRSNGNTPSYIKALLAPTGNSRTSRRAWSIDVESVWVPFFTATNVMGETNLPDDVLGAPIRLAKGKDGEVRFTQSGRPVMRVHPELNALVGVVRENFVAGLQSYVGSVQNERPDAYGVQVAKQQAAGHLIVEADQLEFLEAVEKQRLEAEAAAKAEVQVETAPDSTPADNKAGNSRSQGKPSLRQSQDRAETPDPAPATTPAS